MADVLRGMLAGCRRKRRSKKHRHGKGWSGVYGKEVRTRNEAGANHTPLKITNCMLAYVPINARQRGRCAGSGACGLGGAADGTSDDPTCVVGVRVQREAPGYEYGVAAVEDVGFSLRSRADFVAQN